MPFCNGYTTREVLKIYRTFKIKQKIRIGHSRHKDVITVWCIFWDLRVNISP